MCEVCVYITGAALLLSLLYRGLGKGGFQELRKLERRSSIVVVGKVNSKIGEKQKNGMDFCLVEFNIEDSIKGDLVAGENIGVMQLLLEGHTAIAPGDMAMLFLNKDFSTGSGGQDMYEITGLHKGIFIIDEDKLSSAWQNSNLNVNEALGVLKHSLTT